MSSGYLGELLIRIVGETSQFDSAIDNSGKKFTAASTSIAKGGQEIAQSINKASSVTGEYTNAIKGMTSAQEAAQKKLDYLKNKGVDPLDASYVKAQKTLDKITAQITDVNSAMSANSNSLLTAGSNVKTYNNALEELKARLVEAKNEFINLSSQTNANKDDVEASKQKYLDLDNQVQTLEKNTKIYGSSLDALKAQQKDVQIQMQNLAANGQQNSTAFQDLSQKNNELSQQIKVTEGSTKSFSDRLSELASVAGKFGGVLSASVTAPVVAMAKAAIESASALEVSTNKFNDLFSDVLSEASNDVSELGKKYNQTNQLSIQFLSNSGNVFKSMGASSTAALSYANSIAELTSQISAYSGKSMIDVNNALNLAVLGNTRNLRNYGLAIRESALQDELKKNGQDKLTGSALQLATAEASLKLIIEASATAVENYSKNNESATFSVQELQNEIKQQSSEIGTNFLPAYKGLLSTVKDLLSVWSSMDDSLKSGITTFSLVVAAIGPVELVIAGVAKAIPPVITAFTALTAGTATFATTLSLTVAGVMLLVGALGALATAAEKNQEQKLFTSISDGLAKAVSNGDDLVQTIKEVSDETGVSVTKVAEIAKQSGLVNEENEKQVTLLVKNNEELNKQSESTAEIILKNRQIKEAIDSYRESIRESTGEEADLGKVVDVVANLLNVKKERVIEILLKDKSITQEQRDQLTVMQDQVQAITDQMDAYDLLELHRQQAQSFLAKQKENDKKALQVIASYEASMKNVSGNAKAQLGIIGDFLITMGKLGQQNTSAYANAEKKQKELLSLQTEEEDFLKKKQGYIDDHYASLKALDTLTKSTAGATLTDADKAKVKIAALKTLIKNLVDLSGEFPTQFNNEGGLKELDKYIKEFKGVGGDVEDLKTILDGLSKSTSGLSKAQETYNNSMIKMRAKSQGTLQDLQDERKATDEFIQSLAVLGITNGQLVVQLSDRLGILDYDIEQQKKLETATTSYDTALKTYTEDMAVANAITDDALAKGKAQLAATEKYRESLAKLNLTETDEYKKLSDTRLELITSNAVLQTATDNTKKFNDALSTYNDSMDIVRQHTKGDLQDAKDQLKATETLIDATIKYGDTKSVLFAYLQGEEGRLNALVGGLSDVKDKTEAIGKAEKELSVAGESSKYAPDRITGYKTELAAVEKLITVLGTYNEYTSDEYKGLLVTRLELNNKITAENKLVKSQNAVTDAWDKYKSAIKEAETAEIVEGKTAEETAEAKLKAIRAAQKTISENISIDLPTDDIDTYVSLYKELGVQAQDVLLDLANDVIKNIGKVNESAANDQQNYIRSLLISGKDLTEADISNLDEVLKYNEKNASEIKKIQEKLAKDIIAEQDPIKREMLKTIQDQIPAWKDLGLTATKVQDNIDQSILQFDVDTLIEKIREADTSFAGWGDTARKYADNMIATEGKVTPALVSDLEKLLEETQKTQAERIKFEGDYEEDYGKIEDSITKKANSAGEQRVRDAYTNLLAQVKNMYGKPLDEINAFYEQASAKIKINFDIEDIKTKYADVFKDLPIDTITKSLTGLGELPSFDEFFDSISKGTKTVTEAGEALSKYAGSLSVEGIELLISKNDDLIKSFKDYGLTTDEVTNANIASLLKEATSRKEILSVLLRVAKGDEAYKKSSTENEEERTAKIAEIDGDLTHAIENEQDDRRRHMLMSLQKQVADWKAAGESIINIEKWKTDKINDFDMRASIEKQYRELVLSADTSAEEQVTSFKWMGDKVSENITNALSEFDKISGTGKFASSFDLLADKLNNLMDELNNSTPGTENYVKLTKEVNTTISTMELLGSVIESSNDPEATDELKKAISNLLPVIKENIPALLQVQAIIDSINKKTIKSIEDRKTELNDILNNTSSEEIRERKLQAEKEATLKLIEEINKKSLKKSITVPIDLSSSFNTKLTPEEDSLFKKWGKDNAAILGYDLSTAISDYDMSGFFKNVVLPNPGEEWAREIGKHFTDEFKKPNHMTFSTDSMYSSIDMLGGKWEEVFVNAEDEANRLAGNIDKIAKDASTKWKFTPSQFLLDNKGEKALKDYFAKYEPDAELVIPVTTQLSDADIAKLQEYKEVLDLINKVMGKIKTQTAFQKFSDIFSTISSQVSSLIGQINTLFSTIASAQEEAITHSVEVQENEIDRVLAIQEKAIDDNLEALKDSYGATESELNTMFKTLIRLGDNEAAASIYAQKKKEAAIEDYTSLTVEELEMLKQAALKANDTTTASYIEEAQKRVQAEEDAADAKEKLEKDAANAKIKIENDAALAKYKIELAAFKTSQAFSIAQALIDAAASIIKIWASYSAMPVVAGVLTALTAAATGVQIATIRAQTPPSEPVLQNYQLAKGAVVKATPGGVSATIAEGGEDEVVSPVSTLESMITNAMTKTLDFSVLASAINGLSNAFSDKIIGSTGMSTDTGNIDLTVQLDSEPLFSKIFPATKNKKILISANAIV